MVVGGEAVGGIPAMVLTIRMCRSRQLSRHILPCVL